VPGPRAITGAAGVYHVAAELSEQGWIASLTWGNAPRTDLLAQRQDLPNLLAAIQVKTRRTGSFQVGMGAEASPSPPGANEWFLLVSLAEPRPDFYVLPRNHLGALTYVNHQEWLRAPGRRGQRHRDTTIRSLRDSEVYRYRERWEMLEHPAEDAPCLFGDRQWELYERIGLPEGYPDLPTRLNDGVGP
jgi:hypothetical protein